MTKTTLVAILLFSAPISFAQGSNSCTDAKQHNELISLNTKAEQKGQKLAFTSELKMASKSMVPAAITIDGNLCTINFIADARAKRCNISVIDDKRNQVVKEKFDGGTKTITFKSRPGTKYLFVFSQKLKGKGDGCAAVSILSQ